MPQWCDYMADQVDRRGLQKNRFLARKGDCSFGAHCSFMAGARSKTRHSLGKASSPTTGPKPIVRPNHGTSDLVQLAGGFTSHHSACPVMAHNPCQPRPSPNKSLIDFPSHVSSPEFDDAALREPVGRTAGRVWLRSPRPSVRDRINREGIDDGGELPTPQHGWPMRAWSRSAAVSMTACRKTGSWSGLAATGTGCSIPTRRAT